MKKCRLSMRWVMVLGAMGITLVGAEDASACGGAWIPALEMMPQVDYRPQGVARAEKQLEQGQYASAAGSIIRMMPHIKSLKAKKSASIVARAQRVLAVSIARSGGSLAIEREVPEFVRQGWVGKTQEERQDNLRFAVRTLERISDLKEQSPALQTELAEAMAQLDESQGKAKELLENLAKKDLIATPEGYRALARLRQSAGDKTGQLAALKRCQAMSEDASICVKREAPALSS